MRVLLKHKAILVIPLAITQDVIPRLQAMTAWACDVFSGHMALVVLAHECMAESHLSHQTIQRERERERYSLFLTTVSRLQIESQDGWERTKTTA